MPLPERFRFSLPYLRPHASALVLGTGALAARDAVGAVIPLLVRHAVTLLSEGRTGDAAWVAAAIVGAAVPKAALQSFARYRMMNVSRDVEHDMRNDLFRHLMSLECGFYSRMRTGDVMAHAVNDLNSVRMMTGPGLVNLCDSLVMFPAACAVMAAVDWRLTLLALAPAPLAAALIGWFGARIRRKFESIQAEFSTLSAAVQQHVAGVRAVRAFVQEEVEQRRFEASSRAYARSNEQLGVYTSLADPLLAMLMGLSSLAVLWYGGHAVAAGRMSVGSFAMFMTYMGLLLRPVAAMGRVVNMLQRGSASLDRLRRLFAARPSIAAPASPRALPSRAAGEIAFEGISVRYDGAAALEQIDEVFPAGSCTAVVGRTGCGKTTLARLIPRLLDPASGRVLIDGIDVRELDPDEVRAAVGFVPQETFLFSATLAENIALGSPQASPEAIREAAEIAGLGPDIESFPAGYETVVGERGVLLSGGQRQRVAIARAIVKNPRILVFDDALSSVDSLTEQRILDHLEAQMQGRTTIIVTHRLSTIRRADRILVLEQGRTAESGSHEQLLALGGRYARLWSEQQLEEELATA